MTTRPLLLTAILTASGCASVLEPADLAGTYQAIDFVFSEGIVETDVLAAGGTLDLVLRADGSTTGTLFVPAAVTEDNLDFTADLTGTFSISEGLITFDQVADTFIRDVDWALEGNRLVGGGTFSGVTIVVVLFRT